MSLSFLSSPAENACVIDNDTSATGIHVIQRGACATHCSVQCDIKNHRPLFVSHLVQLSSAAKTGVVDQNVDRAKFFCGLCNEVLNTLFISDIAWNSNDAKFGCSFS